MAKSFLNSRRWKVSRGHIEFCPPGLTKTWLQRLFAAPGAALEAHRAALGAALKHVGLDHGHVSLELGVATVDQWSRCFSKDCHGSSHTIAKERLEKTTDDQLNSTKSLFWMICQCSNGFGTVHKDFCAKLAAQEVVLLYGDHAAMFFRGWALETNLGMVSNCWWMASIELLGNSGVVPLLFQVHGLIDFITFILLSDYGYNCIFHTTLGWLWMHRASPHSPCVLVVTQANLVPWKVSN